MNTKRKTTSKGKRDARSARKAALARVNKARGKFDAPNIDGRCHECGALTASATPEAAQLRGEAAMDVETARRIVAQWQAGRIDAERAMSVISDALREVELTAQRDATQDKLSVSRALLRAIVADVDALGDTRPTSWKEQLEREHWILCSLIEQARKIV